MPETKLHRGDPHHTDPNLVFYAYSRTATGGTRWITRERWDEVKAQTRAYNAARKEDHRRYLKAYYKANAEKIKARSADWYVNNRNQAAEVNKAYRDRNLEKRREQMRAYYVRTKEQRKAQRQEYYEANRQAHLDRARAQKRDPEIKLRRNAREQTRKKTDPLFHLATGVRSRISTEVSKRGFAKNSKSAKVLGCDWHTYKTHLENLFKEGMTWANRAEWHIDHITPLASATTEEGLRALLHYKNTQPLWKDENLRKAARMPDA